MRHLSQARDTRFALERKHVSGESASMDMLELLNEYEIPEVVSRLYFLLFGS